MKNFILSSLMMMTAFLINAQTKGVVLDKDSLPINDVGVFLPDYNIFFNTDELGVFIIDQELPNNTYLSFYKHGYLSELIQYQNNIGLIIILEDAHISIDEIGIRESYNVLGNNKFINIEKRSLKDNFLKSNSIVDNIAQIGGVDVISSGLGIQKLILRGLSGMRVVTYLNGMRIENQQWANDHSIGFTALGLNEVELIKGPSALKYGGEAVGGLLYFKDNPFISTRKLKGFVATKFNHSSYLTDNQFGLKWNKGNLYFNLFGQYLISSDYRLPNNRYLFNSRFRKQGMRFSIGHRYNSWQNIFRYQYNGEQTGIPAHSHDDNPAEVDLTEITSSSLDIFNLDNLFDDYKPTRPTQFVDNQLFIYESNYFINDLKLSIHAGHFINNLQEYEKWTRPAIDMSLSNTKITSNVRYQKNKWNINVGTQIGYLKNKNNIEEELIPDAKTNDIGIYSIADYENGRIGFTGGLRYDHKRINAIDQNYEKLFSNTNYSTGLYYKYLDQIIRLTYSGAFRSPHFAELFANGIHHGTNRYEIGNKELSIEKGYQFDFKYQWSNDHLGLVVNPFLQYINDFITINPIDSFYQNRYRMYNYIQLNRVKLTGVEMNLHYHPHILHNLHFEQSYTFLNTSNSQNQYGLALTPADNIKTKLMVHFNEDSKVLKYKFNSLSVYHLYAFAQDNFAEYEFSTESYSVFNIQLDFKLKKIDFVLGINNLFNASYTPHTSRIREVAGGIPNPGRSFNMNFKYEF